MTILRIGTVLLCLTAPEVQAQQVAAMKAEAEAAGIGGMGVAACRDLIGAQNTPYLAQAGDWLLGYMTGRIDAGGKVAPDRPISAATTLDVVAGIAVFCAENPEATLIAAARDYAGGVFLADPVSDDFEMAPVDFVRPRSRPDDIAGD